MAAPSRDASQLLRHLALSRRRSVNPTLNAKVHAPQVQCARQIATYPSQRHIEALSVLPTAVDRKSNDFKVNMSEMQLLEDRMRQHYDRISKGGPEKARHKHVSRGKMLVREYVIVQYGFVKSITERPLSAV